MGQFVEFIPFAVIIGALITIAWTSAKKARKNIAALGSRLALETIETGKGIKARELKGTVRGRDVRVFSFTTGSGKNRRGWVAISASLNPAAAVRVSFELSRRVAFFEFIARRFRKNEAATGDGTFDQRWVLTTNQPELMGAALLPEIRTRIMGFPTGPSASFKCGDGVVLYAEQDSFSNTKACNRLELALPLLGDLADVVEAGSELNH